MDWDRMQDNWAPVSRRAHQRWGRLTDADLTPVSDQRARLLEWIQVRYGVVSDEAERQIRNWEHKATEGWFSTTDPGGGSLKPLSKR